MAYNPYGSVGGSPLPTAPNQNPTVAFSLPNGVYAWVGTAATNTLTLPPTSGVTSASAVTATVQVDDQQGGGACWLVSATPTTNAITFTLASTTTASSTLRISWVVHGLY